MEILTIILMILFCISMTALYVLTKSVYKMIREGNANKFNYRFNWVSCFCVLALIITFFFECVFGKLELYDFIFKLVITSYLGVITMLYIRIGNKIKKELGEGSLS